MAESWHPRVGNFPAREGERSDGHGNVFWGYSISGSDENGASILPTLAAVHNFPDQMEANARLIAAAPTVTAEGAFLLDRLTDFENRISTDEDAREFHGHVAPAIARFRAAIQSATGEG